MYKRDAPRLFGRSRVAPIDVLRQRRFHQRNSSAHGGQSVDSGHMTALQKPDGKVRGIATGMAFRRLVAKCLARQLPRLWNQSVPHSSSLCPQEREQIAWATSSEPATDDNPALTMTSIDGVGAYDHVYRSAMLAKLLEVAALQGLLPFARFAYSETTTYLWEDDEGVRHHIRQGEGGEQGDPLMPLLFSLGDHDPRRTFARVFG